MVYNKINPDLEIPLERLQEVYKDYSLDHPAMLKKIRELLKELHGIEYTIGVCRTILRESGLSLRTRGKQKIFNLAYTIGGKPVKKVVLKKHKRHENMAEVLESTIV